MLTATNLRFIRTAANLDRKTLAKAAGISTMLLSMIERGTRPMTPTVVRKLRAAIPLDDKTIMSLTDALHQANKTS